MTGPRETPERLRSLAAEHAEQALLTAWKQGRIDHQFLADLLVGLATVEELTDVTFEKAGKVWYIEALGLCGYHHGPFPTLHAALTALAQEALRQQLAGTARRER